MNSQEGQSRTLEMLWRTRSPTNRGPRPRVSLEDIAHAGVQQADAHGITGLTLAGVAAEIGMTATALYRHLDSKEALVELIVDRAIGEPPELEGATWQDRAQEWTRSLCRRYRQHPWVLTVQIPGPPRHPSALAWIDLLLRELDQGPAEDPMRLSLLLDALARAFALITGIPDSEAPRSEPPQWLHATIAQRHPRLAAELDRDWTDIDDELTHAVDIVLAGVELLHADTGTRTSSRS